MEREPGGQPAAAAAIAETGGGMCQIEVACSLSRVRFPGMCAHCGGEPAGALYLRKMFWRVYHDSSIPSEHIFPGLSIPFCRACLAAHEAARRPPDPRVLRKLSNRWLLSTLPYWLPIGVIIFLSVRFLPKALDSATSGRRPDMMIGIGLMAFLAVALVGFVRLMFQGRAQQIADCPGDPAMLCVDIVRGPLGVTCFLPGPPTPILASVNFSDEQRGLVDGNRRIFSFTNSDVAAAFAAANADLIWDPASPRAVRARWMNRIVIGVVIVLAIWMMLNG